VKHDEPTTTDLICGMLTIAALLATLWTLAALLCKIFPLCLPATFVVL